MPRPTGKLAETVRKQNLRLIRTMTLFQKFVAMQRPALIDLHANSEGASLMMRLDESLAAAKLTGVQSRVIQHNAFAPGHSDATLALHYLFDLSDIPAAVSTPSPLGSDARSSSRSWAEQTTRLDFFSRCDTFYRKSGVRYTLTLRVASTRP